MTFVVAITGYDFVAAQAKTLYFTKGAGVAFSDLGYVAGQVKSWSSPTQRIDVNASGRVLTGGDDGSLVLDNAPDSISIAGPLDTLMDYAWAGQRAELYYVVDGAAWATRQLVAWGTMRQPVCAMTLGAQVESTIQFPLRDVRSQTDGSLQPTKYGGTNVANVGVDGTASDLKGKPLPILYGRVSNIPGQRVNAQLLIFQLSDRPAEILCVRDGAVALTASTQRGSLSSLQTTSPSPGSFDYYTGAEGLFIRLGSSPIYAVTFDAREGGSDAARTHAQIWDRLRQRIGASTNDAGHPDTSTSMTATDALDSAEAGFWWPDEISQKDALDEVLSSFSGYELQNVAGAWLVRKLVLPTGTPVVSCVVLGPTSELGVTDRELLTIQRAVPAYATDNAPPYKVTVQWGRNYTEMSDSDFAGSANQRLKDKFVQEWRTTWSTDTTLWDPMAKTGPWPNAPEMVINSGYQGDFVALGCPGADAEAARLLTIYKVVRGQYQVGFRWRTGDVVLPGDPVRITHPQMGLAGGKLFATMQSQFVLDESGNAGLALIVGLQN